MRIHPEKLNELGKKVWYVYLIENKAKKRRIKKKIPSFKWIRHDEITRILMSRSRMHSRILEEFVNQNQ